MALHAISNHGRGLRGALGQIEDAAPTNPLTKMLLFVGLGVASGWALSRRMPNTNLPILGGLGRMGAKSARQRKFGKVSKVCNRKKTKAARRRCWKSYY